jgi:hypothetical protein
MYRRRDIRTKEETAVTETPIPALAPLERLSEVGSRARGVSVGWGGFEAVVVLVVEMAMLGFEGGCVGALLPLPFPPPTLLVGVVVNKEEGDDIGERSVVVLDVELDDRGVLAVSVLDDDVLGVVLTPFPSPTPIALHAPITAFIAML